MLTRSKLKNEDKALKFSATNPKNYRFTDESSVKIPMHRHDESLLLSRGALIILDFVFYEKSLKLSFVLKNADFTMCITFAGGVGKIQR